MEVRQLRYFVAVAEELHFGRAAERLGIVQPAVSQQIGRLERELGVRLLDRTPRRVALTGDGARLLVEARAALAAVDRVRSVAEDLASGRTGVFRLGTSPGLGERLRRGVGTLRVSSPELGLRLVEGRAADHARAIRRGELDAALVRGEVPGTRSVRLWEEPLRVVLPRAHPAAGGPVAVRELKDLRLRLPADPALEAAVLGRCAEEGLDPERGREVRSVEDTAVEIAAGDRDWTVVYGEQAGLASCGAMLRPFAPPLTVPGLLLLPADGARECADALAAAFS
ncbi:LysR family transcriptional regulator [Pseudonocardia sp. WMMC193]|uniref:LysR family transcriptional regulator n=1 Tax=Pseudonocardia sp. WMMC193 TaxID=2911965 RepID=UPI0027DF3E94|nr:LysR family transcriptional regulator [Pseudonocardia sp. WMMC193]